MIYINSASALKRLDPKDTYILVDYDRTITTYDSTTTWGMLEGNSIADITYIKEQKAVYEKYRKEEVKTNLNPKQKFNIMREWAVTAFNNIYKYRICEETINNVLKSNHGMKLRHDSAEFLRKMKEMEIPVIIISAGLGVFIEKYLSQQNVLFDNITIHSNFFVYENGSIISVRQPILHSANKGTVNYQDQIIGRSNGILIGDQIEDIKTAKDNECIKVGFCDINTYYVEDYNRKFDITLTGESSFNNALKILVKGYK